MLQLVAVPNKHLNDYASLVGRALADEIREREMSDGWDVCIVHDPQPAALSSRVPEKSGRWVWRCHIDLSTPNPDTVSRLLPYLDPDPAAVFHMWTYVPADMDGRAYVIPPAIDPLAPKSSRPRTRCTSVSSLGSTSTGRSCVRCRGSIPGRIRSR